MFKSILAATGFAALALLAAPLRAADLPGGFFFDTPTCFERVYTAGHLRQHPAQRVTRIRFEHFPHIWGATDDAGRVNPRLQPRQVFFRVLVSLRGKRPGDNSGTCYAEDGRLNCYIECDGGGFELVRDGANKMLIRNQGFAVSGCDAGSEAEGTWVNPKPDDKVFRLYRLPQSACRAPLALTGR